MNIYIDISNSGNINQALKQLYKSLNELPSTIKVDPSHTDEKYKISENLNAIQDDIFGLLSDTNLKKTSEAKLLILFSGIEEFRKKNLTDYLIFTDLLNWLKKDLKESSNIDFSFDISS